MLLLLMPALGSGGGLVAGATGHQSGWRGQRPAASESERASPKEVWWHQWAGISANNNKHANYNYERQHASRSCVSSGRRTAGAPLSSCVSAGRIVAHRIWLAFNWLARRAGQLNFVGRIHKQ